MSQQAKLSRFFQRKSDASATPDKTTTPHSSNANRHKSSNLSTPSASTSASSVSTLRRRPRTADADEDKTNLKKRVLGSTIDLASDSDQDDDVVVRVRPGSKRRIDGAAVKTQSKQHEMTVAKEESQFVLHQSAASAGPVSLSAQQALVENKLNNSIDVEVDVAQVRLDLRSRLQSLRAQSAIINEEEDDDASTFGPSANDKLTPLEKQVSDLMDKYPDTLLAIESGYRFRFFGEHATIAARLLDIVAYKDHAFMVASVPVHRITVHVRRLVEAGHKVGIVRQTETAALKKAGKSKGTKSGLFTRDVTALFTRGTWIEGWEFAPGSSSSSTGGGATSGGANIGSSSGGRGGRRPPWLKFGPKKSADSSDSKQSGDGEGNDDSKSLTADNTGKQENDSGGVDFATTMSSTRYLLVIIELNSEQTQSAVGMLQDGWALGESLPKLSCVHVGIAAVAVGSGEVMWGSFEDSCERPVLRACLEHLQPVEILMPGPILSEATEAAIDSFVEMKGRTDSMPVRTERLAADVCFDDELAARLVNEICVTTKLNGSIGGSGYIGGDNDCNGTGRNEHVVNDDDNDGDTVASSLDVLDRSAKLALASVIGVLKQFKLENVMKPLDKLRRWHGPANAPITRTPAAILAESGGVDICVDGDVAIQKSDDTSANDNSAALRKSAVDAAVVAVLQNTQPVSPKQQYQHQRTMELDANALRDLDIVYTSNGGAKAGERGSLLWLVDHTRTPMGRRLLHEWVTHPLIHAHSIQLRQDAVTWLLEKASARPVVVLKSAFQALKRLDLDNGLQRILQRRCTLAQVLKHLDYIVNMCTALQGFAKGLVDLSTQQADEDRGECTKALPRSVLLSDIVGSVDTRQTTLHVRGLQSGIDRTAAEANDLRGAFGGDPTRFPEVAQAKDAIVAVENELKVQLKDIRKVLRRPALVFKTLRLGVNSTLEYLVEIPKNTVVPRGWVEVSSTQKLSRFIPPDVQELIDTLALRREELDVAASASLQALCKNITDNHQRALDAVSRATSHLDALMSLAVVANQPGYVKPRIDMNDGPDTGCYLDAKVARHPVLEKVSLAESSVYVPNDIQLGYRGGLNCDDTVDELTRVMLITGSCAGGKSSYVRMAALIIILAQMGSYVPADVCSLGVFDAIQSRMGASDDLFQGHSTFLVEMRQASRMINTATPRSLLIFDELGRGTSTMDGTAIALASLRFMVQELKCAGMFITHYTMLATLEQDFKPRDLQAFHMAFLQERVLDASGTIPARYGSKTGSLADSLTGSKAGSIYKSGCLGVINADASADKKSETIQGSVDADDDVKMSEGAISENVGAGEGVLVSDQQSQEHEPEERIVFLYQLARGAASQSYGLNVAWLAGVPSSIVVEARTKARELEAAVTAREQAANAKETEV